MPGQTSENAFETYIEEILLTRDGWKIANAACLHAKTAVLDALDGKVEAAVERLQEFRTALIAAAVTGKIDVRKESHA